MEVAKIDIDNKEMQLIDILHCFRVANLTASLSELIQLDSVIKKQIFIAAILHDIGKSMIDTTVLNKEEGLTDLEWRQLKCHAELGGMIANSMCHETDVIKSIVQHHENYDGTGYPRKLKGEEIIIGAQIIRICDSYDAIRMRRPYKKSFTHSKAIEELLLKKAHYNPYLLKRFFQLDFQNINLIGDEDII